MKFKILNGEPLQFYDSAANLMGTIQVSGSGGDLYIRPDSGSSRNVIIGSSDTVGDVEIGITSTPVNLKLLGGGTLTSNGNILYIGESATNDRVIISGATFTSSLQITGSLRVSGSAYAQYFVGDGSGLTNVPAAVAIKDEGVILTSTVSSIDFVGAAVSSSVVGNAVTVTITGGGGSTDTGSLLTTASFSNPNLTLTKGDASTFAIDLSTLQPATASYALTASYSLNAGTTIDTGSFVTTSSFNSFTSSYATGSFTGSFVGTLTGTASFATTAATASYVLNSVSSSFATTASYVKSAETASYITTLNQNVVITGSVDVSSGHINITDNAYFFQGTAVNGDNVSLIGVNTDDVIVIGNQGFDNIIQGDTDIWGGLTISGSLLVSASVSTISGSLTVTSGVTASLYGTSSFAITASYYGGSVISASYAETASYVLNAVSSSFSNNAVTASYVLNAVSSSFASNAISSSYALTASFALNGGGGAAFPYTGSATISGSLTVTGPITSTQTISGSRLYLSSSALPTASAVLTLIGSGSELLTVDGALGRLFAVTDDLSDSLFSVNTVAGLPVMEAFATNNVNLGKFGVYPIKIINSGSTAVVSGSFTGSMVGNLTGTASFATSASFTTTASFAATASSVNPLNQSVFISASLTVTGSVNILQNITASRAIISGSTNTASGSILTVIGSGSAQPVFTVIGSSGELFSITDSLSGSLFSVNDISGLPILEVFSDSTTVVGDYQAPSLLTTKAATLNTGNTLIYSIPTASYAGAWFDYTVTSASNARCGTVMAMRNGSSIVYTETTTTDIGSTAGVAFMVMITGSSMALTGSATSPSWSFKSIIRSI